MALLSELITNVPIGLLVFFTPLIYVLHVRTAHRLCENYLNEQITNIIKFLIPIPSELTVRCVLLSYSFLCTMLALEFVFSVVVMVLFMLF